MNLDGNVVGNWLADNVVFVLVVCAAIVILVAALKKNVRDAMMTLVIVLIGLLVVALAVYWRELGEWIRITFFGG